jgi:hypothetical protein
MSQSDFARAKIGFRRQLEDAIGDLGNAQKFHAVDTLGKLLDDLDAIGYFKPDFLALSLTDSQARRVAREVVHGAAGPVAVLMAGVDALGSRRMLVEDLLSNVRMHVSADGTARLLGHTVSVPVGSDTVVPPEIDAEYVPASQIGEVRDAVPLTFVLHTHDRDGGEATYSVALCERAFDTPPLRSRDVMPAVA